MNDRQPDTSPPSNSQGALTLIIAATVCLLAVRWTGYAALPYAVIFAPLLSMVGIMLFALLLAGIVVVATMIAKKK